MINSLGRVVGFTVVLLVVVGFTVVLFVVVGGAVVVTEVKINRNNGKNNYFEELANIPFTLYGDGSCESYWTLDYRIDPISVPVVS